MNEKKISILLNYPKHWDTSAYPTLEDAIIEMIGWAQATEKSIRRRAKQEIFDDIEKLSAFDEEKDTHKQIIVLPIGWERFKEKHLHPITDTASKGSI